MTIKQFFNRAVLAVALVLITTAAQAQDAVPALSITSQPVSISIAQKDKSVTLSCTATKGESTVAYQWYSNVENKNTGGTPITGATSADYTTEPFTDKEIRYYYCVATVGEESLTSDVSVVAYTGLPTVVIETVDGEEPTAEYAYPPSGAYGRGLKNATKVPSSMIIFDGVGTSVYESGKYNKEEKTGLTIKLRGNTSASLTGKSPYKLKLQTKADLLAPFISGRDDKYADKEWILLKDGTSLKTFIGMTVCDMAGTPWTPEFTYANVVINNTYRGVYMLIEAISRGEKRIDVNKKNGYIIERDAYWWNEDVKFITTKYNQKYTFKFPDDEDITANPELLEYIENYMNTLEQHVADGTYEDYLDVESFARWLLIHDILGTWDSGGSNMYMYKYDNTDAKKVYMATNWDFDSMYRQKDTWANQHNGSRVYAAYLFQSNNRTFIESYQAQWEALKDNIWTNLSTALNTLKDNIGAEINISRQLDAIKWKSSYTTVEANITEAQNWYTSRTTWMEEAIDETHTITYNLNGGNYASGAVYPSSFGFGDVFKFTNPTRTGYSFSGWTYGTVTSPKSNLTFYGCTCFSDLAFKANWKKLLTNADIVVSDIDDQTFTGTEFTPSIVVTDGTKTLVANTDYTITLPSGRINTGNYTVTITGKGNYSGKVTKTFTINPQVEYYGALTITTDQTGKKASLDDAAYKDNTEDLAYSLDHEIDVDEITFNRTFNGNSTIILPFSIPAGKYSGGTFCTFKNVVYEDSKWYADATEVPSTADIEANKPYIFKPSGADAKLTIEGGVTLTANAEAQHSALGTDDPAEKWSFIGVYKKKFWADGNIQAYGFAGGDKGDDIKIGDFVCAGLRSSIRPFRCYLEYYDPNGLSKSVVALPDRIEVRIVSAVIEPDEPSDEPFDNDFETPVAEINPSLASSAKVWSYEKTIYIESAPNTQYAVIDLTGRSLRTGVTASTHDEIALPGNVDGIVIVRIANKSFKIRY